MLCPRCGKFTLTKRSDVLPPPPGTDWLPLPRDWSACSNCGYDSRSRPSVPRSHRTEGSQDVRVLGGILVALSIIAVIVGWNGSVLSWMLWGLIILVIIAIFTLNGKR